MRKLVATTKAERLQGRPEHIGKAAWRQQWPYPAKDGRHRATHKLPPHA